MNCRTDLALECQELLGDDPQNGINIKKWSAEKSEITEIEIFNEDGEKALGKPKGKYITIELSEFSHESELLDSRLNVITKIIRDFLPVGDETVLVAGLGNEKITPDALGPLCAEGIFSTRHIESETAKELSLPKLRPVAAVSTGVLGQTGIETAEYIKGLVEFIKPSAVIVVDALASRRLERVGKTIQMSDTGIIPGSGVGNSRAEINKRSLGVPVISIGVPTVVDAATIVHDLTSESTNKNNIDKNAKFMMVTPRDIDTVIVRAARLISLGINCALQPNLSPDNFLSLI